MVQHIRFRFLLATDFLYKVVVVVFDFFTVPSMPKAQKLSANKSAVLARERREKEKQENQYNAVLKEFVLFKYNHIIAEFEPFYENLKTNRPEAMIYTNTSEFRLWRKQLMEKTFSHGEQPEQQPEHVEQQPVQPEHVEQQPEQSEHVEQQPEQSEHVEQQPEQPEQQNEQLLQQMPLPEQLARLVDEMVGELDVLDEPLLPEQLGDLADEIVTDEGIVLDPYEELHADIETFDYRLEVELEQYM